MAYIHLVRHGQAHCMGQDCDHLTQNGRVQTAMLAEYYANGGVHIDLIGSGDQKRQLETAERFRSVYTSRRLPVPDIKIFTQLNELDAQQWLRLGEEIGSEDPNFRRLLEKWKDIRLRSERKSGLVFAQLTGEILKRWQGNRFSKNSIEPFEEYVRRVKSLPESLTGLNQDTNVFLFTSATPIAILIQSALEIKEPELILKAVRWLYNSSVSTFYLHRRRLELISMNKVPHVPNPKARTLV